MSRTVAGDTVSFNEGKVTQWMPCELNEAVIIDVGAST